MPWTLSTGPQTAVGKARSARNAWKGGQRANLSHWREILRSLEEGGRQVISLIGRKTRLSRTRHHLPKKPIPVPNTSFTPGQERDEIDNMSSHDLLNAFRRLISIAPAVKT